MRVARAHTQSQEQRYAHKSIYRQSYIYVYFLARAHAVDEVDWPVSAVLGHRVHFTEKVFKLC